MLKERFYSTKTVFDFVLTTLIILSPKLSYGEADVLESINFEKISAEINQIFSDFTLDLNKKNLGDLINLFAFDFELNKYFIESLQKSTEGQNFDQQVIANKMKNIQGNFQTFQNNCDQKTLESHSAIQQVIGKALPENLMKAMKETQNSFATLLKQSEKSKNKKEAAKLEKQFLIIQRKMFSEGTQITTLTNKIKSHIYRILYAKTEQLCKQCLVKKVSIDGIININKRKAQVIHPDQADKIIFEAERLTNDMFTQFSEKTTDETEAS